MIILACGVKIEKQKAYFNDMTDEAWYTDYIGTAMTLGIVGGIGDNNFGVGMNITRQDARRAAWQCAVRARPHRHRCRQYTDFYLDEIRAINEKLKELGWLEEK